MPARRINKVDFLMAVRRQRAGALNSSPQSSPQSPHSLSFETSKTPFGTVTGHTGCFSAFYSHQPGFVPPPIQGYLLDSFTARMDQTCGRLGNLSYRCDVLRAEEEIKAYAYFFRGPRGWQTLLASLQRWISAGSLTMIRGDDSPLPHVRFSMEEVEISGDFMLLRRKEQDSIMLGSD
ncbi:hypothetical protein FDECE_2646 [Fusarium decemcellulare]|nr:hypothetical protein FDECE_2646 [Fusarium decemcellulare]